MVCQRTLEAALPRHVIQINFAFDEPMQSNTNYAGDCVDCANEFILSLARNGRVIGDGSSFWSRPDLFSWIGYSLHADVLAPDSLAAESKNCLDQLKELDCKVSSQKLGADGGDAKTVTKPEYLILHSNTSDSPISTQNGNPYNPFSLLLDDSLRAELSEWNSIYNALYTVWLSLEEMDRDAYKQLADIDSEINSKGRAICEDIELASGIPTYYFLLRSAGYIENEFWRKCPKCDQNWQSPTEESPDYWNFEFRCVACRLVSSQGDDYENKSQPDNSDQGYQYLMEGTDMSPAQIVAMEERVANDSNDLQARLSLIGYYHHVPMERRTTTKALPHIMWLVENHSAAYICRNLCLGKPYTDEQNLEFEKLWLEQIRLHPTNDKIVGNAGLNIRGTNEKLGWHYISQAAALNPTEPYWIREIAHHSAYEALNGHKAEREHHAEIAIREAEKFFKLQDTSGERFSMCKDVTPVAIQFGYLNEARKWNKWVLDHMNYSVFGQFAQYAWLFLALIELTDGKAKKSKILLRKALCSIQVGTASASATSSTMVALLNQLLESGHREIVLEALRVCEDKCSEDRRERLQEWLRLIEQEENPKLEWGGL